MSELAELLAEGFGQEPCRPTRASWARGSSVSLTGRSTPVARWWWRPSPRPPADGQGAGESSGRRNVALFSTHYLTTRATHLADWAELAELGRLASRERGVAKRLEALGFNVDKKSEGIYVLRAQGRPAAAVLSYPSGHDLDRAASPREGPLAGESHT